MSLEAWPYPFDPARVIDRPPPSAACPDCGVSINNPADRTIVHHQTCPISVDTERAMTKDRQFFLDHPRASSYVRKLLPGERAEGQWAGGDFTHCRVTQIAPGHRTRQMFHINATHLELP